MKVYMNKGLTMSASILFHPYDVEARKDPETIPESIREWIITINGDGNEKIILVGTLKDLETVIMGLRNVWIDIVMQEKEGRK